MRDALRAKFYEAIDRAYVGHPMDDPYVDMDYSEVVLDGKFKLEYLKALVAAWEEYRQAVDAERMNT